MTTSSPSAPTLGPATAGLRPGAAALRPGAADAEPLPVTDRGSGGPALVFVPGWCGDRTVFDPLVQGCARHRRSVSVDLPGHGESRAHGDYDSAELADALVATLDAAGVEAFVPVALSHAGWTALELRHRLGPERVPGVVLLDWMPLGTPPGFADALAGLQSSAWQEVRAALQDLWTAGLDLPALQRYVADMGTYGQEHWRRAGREIAAGFERHPVPLEAFAAAQPCPVLHLYAQPTDPGHLAAQQAWAREHGWFSVRRLEAASHFPMFEVPAEMVAAMEEFVEGLA